AVRRAVRHEDYVQEGLPYVDASELLSIPDETARPGALRSGQISQANRLTLAQAESVKSDDIVVQTTAAMSNGLFGGDLLTDPFMDIRVRQAVGLATDRDAALATIIQNDGVMGSPLYDPRFGLSEEELRKQPGYDSTRKPQDIEQARALLSDAGYADGFETSIITHGGDDRYQAIAVFAQDQLRNIGINVSIDALEQTV